MTFPREVTRIERCKGLISTFDAIGMSVSTGPSQSPARGFRISKEVCASDFGAGVLAAPACVEATVECSCALDCAKATVESEIRTTESKKRRDFIFPSPYGPRFFVGILRWGRIRWKRISARCVLLYITITVLHMSSSFLSFFEPP